jgi:hypothetical protein
MRASAVSAPAPHKFTILSAVGGLVLLVMLVRLILFAQAPAPLPAIGWSVTPWNAFVTRHACTTAYWSAATEVKRAPDVYATLQTVAILTLFAMAVRVGRSAAVHTAGAAA